jgi:hypothetical protein
MAAVAGEPFVGSVSRIDAETRKMMVGSSWHRGCPVPIRALRLMRLRYEGLDGEAHRGRLVVHRPWADEVLEVFSRLYRRAFPIRRVRLVEGLPAPVGERPLRSVRGEPGQLENGPGRPRRRTLPTWHHEEHPPAKLPAARRAYTWKETG